MKNSGLVCLSAVVILTFASLGCGYNGSADPASGLPKGFSISGTAHPLVAQYTITHPQPGMSAWVEFGTDTTYGRQTSVVNSSPTSAGGQSLSILVAGMLPQTTYHMRAHADWASYSFVFPDSTFTTGALPTSLPLPKIAAGVPGSTTAATQAPVPGVELLSAIVEPLATDLQGNVIWYCPMPALPIKLMQNGHFILVEAPNLLEVDLTCNIIRAISLSQVNQSLQTQGHSYQVLNFSHDVLTLPNGHWVTIGQISRDFTDLPGYPGITSVLGDLLLDIDPTGNVAWSWSAFDHLDITRYPYFGLPDWTHGNALVYTQDGDLLFSSRHQAWIIKIDYANGTGTGNALWKLGLDGDFTLLGGDPSQWFFAQHNPNILSVNGSQTTLAVYDNGNFRIDPSTGLQCNAGGPACYSRATIFQLDEDTMIATLSWQDLPGYFSAWGGSINLLSNGDMEFASSDPFNSAAAQITEVTPTDSPQVVWQMNVTGTNVYRGQRIPSLYPGVTWQK